MGYICVICNEHKNYRNLNEVDFLWDDKKLNGLPVCRECVANTLHGWVIKNHLNYEAPIIAPKKIGLEVWL